MAYTVQHKRSSDPNKRPKPEELVDGQIAVNLDDSSPGMFVKTDNGAIIKIGPAHYGASAPVATNHPVLTVGEIWVDSSIPDKVIIKVWDGTQWVGIKSDSESSSIIDNLEGIGNIILGRGCATPDTVSINATTSINCGLTVTGGPIILGGGDCNTDSIQLNGNVAFNCGLTLTETLESEHILPSTDCSYDLGSPGQRWRNVYTCDLLLSNEGSANEVDGSWGSWVIQEGEEDLFIINKRSGKRYRFNLEEVS